MKKVFIFTVLALISSNDIFAQYQLKKDYVSIGEFHQGIAIVRLTAMSFNGGSSLNDLSISSIFGYSGISELILDLRYCSGGSYSVLNDFVGIISPAAINGLAYLKRNYNSDHTAYDSTYIIRKTGLLNLSRIFVITSSGTANIPEYLINGLSPYMDVIKIGNRTRGSGYSESYWTFGQKRHYLVTSIFTNAQNANLLNGISPDCYVADGVDRPWGDENEDCLNTALSYIDNGVFPVTGRSVRLESNAPIIQTIIQTASPAEILPTPKEIPPKIQ